VDVGAIMGEIRKAPVDRQHTLLGALADPTRLQMAHLLARTDELCVCDFTAAFDVGQPTVSHHLRVLREAGIVTSRKAGQWVYYTLDRTALKWLVGTLLEMM
jgi:ArsR family transcriptional regulator